MPAAQFIVPEHLVVPADVARTLVALLAPGRAQARNDGLLVGNDRVTSWLRELDKVAAATRPATATSTPRPEVIEVRERWIPTAEVARRLGLSDRRARDLRITKRRHGRGWVWLEADVDALAEWRGAVADSCGTHRKPPTGTRRTMAT